MTMVGRGHSLQRKSILKSIFIDEYTWTNNKEKLNFPKNFENGGAPDAEIWTTEKKNLLNACKADVIEGWRVRENQEIFLHVWLDSKL